MRGHWFRAEEQLRACLANPAALPVMTRWCESTLVEVLTILGRLDEAEEQLGSSFVGVAGELNGLMGRVREAELAYARGDYSKHDAFKDFVEYHQALGMTSPTMTRWQCHYAEGIAQCGRGEEAAALMKAYLERALEVGDPLCIGEAHTLLGRLSPTAAALAHFEQACDALRSTPHGWHLAAAELGLGAALRRDNQRVRARAPLQSALDYATRHGAAEIERQAREELGLIGARVHNPFLSGAESLTPAELRVARLAADGLTNREIAQHLFLTRKTVEMHMSRTLRKLDIASRKELPAALADS
jgi:DNA-binding CsgD family transcriptional regulator